MSDLQSLVNDKLTIAEARIEDAERIRELEARIYALERRSVVSYSTPRIRRLHRWLRKARVGRHNMFRVVVAGSRRAAMADELAAVLRSIAREYRYDVGECLAQPGGPCDMCRHIDAARTLLIRYDATKEAP